jgi:hypothetical protein
VYASGALATKATATFSEPGEPIIPEVTLLGKELIFLVELDFVLPAPDATTPDPGDNPEPEPGDPVIVSGVGSAIGTATVVGVGDVVIEEEQSTDFVFPTLGANISVGDTSWINPGNVTASDQARATCTRSTIGTTQRLYASNFNFSDIPDAAQITTVDLLVERSYTGGPAEIRDSIVQITIDGTTLAGINKADTVSTWVLGDTEEVIQYTFAASEAGNPTAAQVKAPSFGAVVQASFDNISGGAGYTANPVNFNGTTYLLREGGLTGAVDGPNATVSFWFRRLATGVAHNFINAQGNVRFFFGVQATNVPRIRMRNVSNVNIVEVDFPAVTDSNWHHIMFARTTGAAHAYLDGVVDTVDLNTADSIDWTLTNWSIGAQVDGLVPLDGDLADVWVDDVYIDLSQAANRAKFFLGGGPVNLGTDGSTPTGSAPLIFLSGPTSNWHVNLGTGGGFTELGSLVDGTTPLPTGSGGGGSSATARIDAISMQISYAGAEPPPGGNVDGTGSSSGSTTVTGVGDTVGGTGGSGLSFTTGFDSGFG